MNYDKIIIFGCSFSKDSLRTNTSYGKILGEKYNIPVINHSVNGSSNLYNYFKSN